MIWNYDIPELDAAAEKSFNLVVPGVFLLLKDLELCYSREVLQLLENTKNPVELYGFWKLQNQDSSDES